MGALKYIGGGVFMRSGQPVPNRDLTADEVEFYGGERVLLKSGLYVKPPRPPQTETLKASEEVDDGGISEN